MAAFSGDWLVIFRLLAMELEVANAVLNAYDQALVCSAYICEGSWIRELKAIERGDVDWKVSLDVALRHTFVSAMSYEGVEIER